MFKRLLLPPVWPVILLALLALWVIADETKSAPRMINGDPDDAPIRAAGILFYIAPILYIPFAILNCIDALFDRFKRSISWAVSLLIFVLFSGLLSTIFYRPSIDSSTTGIGISILIAALLFLPMTIFRRLILSLKQNTVTIIPTSVIPFENLFQESRTPKQ